MSSKTLLKLGGTQNKAWVENAEKSYGMKLMKTMGWKEGEGLGKDGDGQQTHIQIKLRTENEGLGLDESDRTNQTFISTIGNFEDVLQGLNKEHSDVRKQMKKMEKKDKKKKEKREREKKKPKVVSKAVARHKYKKVLKNKTISNYSADDLNAILGISP